MTGQRNSFIGLLTTSARLRAKVQTGVLKIDGFYPHRILSEKFEINLFIIDLLNLFKNGTVLQRTVLFKMTTRLGCI